MIFRVDNEEDAKVCDCLLTDLIADEKKYNKNISDFFSVVDFYPNEIKNKENFLYAYKINDNIVSYIFLKPQKDDLMNGYLLDALFVNEEYRHQGIASKLVEYALNNISDDINFIDVNAMYQNESAIKLYEKFGFNKYKVTMRKDK